MIRLLGPNVFFYSHRFDDTLLNCVAYKALESSITKDESEIKKLDGQLQQDQSQYLIKYFQEVNLIFETLGSGNFKLEKEAGGRGHLPVYSLKVTFHGVSIPNDKLGSVFSESDRRALALSVFLVKVKLKSKSMPLMITGKRARRRCSD